MSLIRQWRAAWTGRCRKPSAGCHLLAARREPTPRTDRAEQLRFRRRTYNLTAIDQAAIPYPPSNPPQRPSGADNHKPKPRLAPPTPGPGVARPDRYPALLADRPGPARGGPVVSPRRRGPLVGVQPPPLGLPVSGLPGPRQPAADRQPADPGGNLGLDRLAAVAALRGLRPGADPARTRPGDQRGHQGLLGATQAPSDRRTRRHPGLCPPAGPPPRGSRDVLPQWPQRGGVRPGGLLSDLAAASAASGLDRAAHIGRPGRTDRGRTHDRRRSLSLGRHLVRGADLCGGLGALLVRPAHPPA